MSQQEEQSDTSVPSASILPALAVVAIGAGIVYLSRSSGLSLASIVSQPTSVNVQTPTYTSGPTSPNTAQVRSSINTLLEERFK